MFRDELAAQAKDSCGAELGNRSLPMAPEALTSRGGLSDLAGLEA